jgi:very-short-patch-repair endonuclease
VDGLAVRIFIPRIRVVDSPPHPDPLPASGEREQKRCSGCEHPLVFANSICSKLSSVDAKERFFMRGAKLGKTNIARQLRRNATIAEQQLWYRLRSRSLYGVKFVRQEPIGPYIVDFVCREQRLIIEVDGGQHAENERDVVRDRWLRDHGYRVLRFWNNDVIENADGVLEAIAEVLGASPSPRLRGEGRGEGAFPQAQTRRDAPSPDLSPHTGRGEGRGKG